MTRVSVVTVCFNSADTIRDTLISVASQTHGDVEHIIIDGGSTDDTLDVIREHGRHVAKVVSEPDKGIYDAMNKGFALTTGELVAFLNSDDCYSNSAVLAHVAEAYESSHCDYVYGDLLMVDAENKAIRDWRVGDISMSSEARQVPHPTFFCRREMLSRINPVFDARYTISADLKQQLLIRKMFSGCGFYLNDHLVKMKVGGRSTGKVSGYFMGWRESVMAYNEVYGGGGILFTVRKILRKVPGVLTYKISRLISG